MPGSGTRTRAGRRTTSWRRTQRPSAVYPGAVAALPPEAFVAESAETPGYFRWRDTAGELESDFSGHLRDHVDDVRGWLATG